MSSTVRPIALAFGIGAHASRATVLTGNAVNVTALKLRDKALAYASELLQTATSELDIVDGVVVTRGTSIGPSISLAEIAGRLAPGARLLGDREPGLYRGRLVQHGSSRLLLWRSRRARPDRS